MSKTIRYLFTLAVPVAVGLGALWLYDQQRPQAAAMSYDTTAVARGSIRKLVSTSGPVRALVTVSVGSQLSGQVLELKADFNSEVKPNDILAVIDDKSFAARVAQSKADLAMSEAQLANSDAALRRAEAVLKQAERTIARQQTLATKGITTQTSVDTAVRDVDVAKAEISVANAQIVSAKAQIEQRKAALDQAQIDLDRTRIRSPIDGTVIGRTIDIGQTVAASLQAPELFKIAQDLRRIRLEAQVNEADVGSVAEGNAVTFTVDAYPERSFQGRVTQVRLAATELQNVVTYTVIIEAANEDRRLFPGMTANVQIETAKRDDVLRVSNDALRFKPRDPQPAQQPAASTPAQRAERSGRMLEQLKDELKLTDEQQAALKTALDAFFAEGRAQRGGAGQGGQGAPAASPSFGGGAQASLDPASGFRQRMMQKVESVLTAILTEDQRPLFDRWRRGRENSRSATVWVLPASGVPESRSIRLGIADDQYAEVVGGPLKEGERIIQRAREVKK